jgi:dCMP deaminase
MHVGAIIAHEGRTIATGYNGAPVGMPHCEHRCDCYPDNITRGWRSLGPDGVAHEPNCTSRQPCRRAVHAEANAIAFAARYGMATAGATLVVTMQPCLPCAQLVVNAGIVRVVFTTGYRDNAGRELLAAAGVQLNRWV